MNTEKEVEQVGKGLVGCTGLVIQMFLVYPIWYILLFVILQRIEPPTWTWVLYIIYIPATLLTSIIGEFFRGMGK